MAGIDAFSTSLQRSDGTTFTAIANVTSISGPGLSRETLDMTAHDSPNQWREYLGGLKDGGEVSTDVNYDPAEHDTLLDDWSSDAPIDYQLVFPDSAGTTWGFSAVMTGFEPSAPHDDKLAASLTWQLSGMPNFMASGS